MLTNVTKVNPYNCCRTVINTLWNAFSPKLFFIDDPELNLLNMGLFTKVTNSGYSNDNICEKHNDYINISNETMLTLLKNYKL